jgi:hypothetical protein
MRQAHFRKRFSRPVRCLGKRGTAAAGDGHVELYKSTMKYDGDLGREQHGLPSHRELPL